MAVSRARSELAQFVGELKRLRLQAGNPTLRRMEELSVGHIRPLRRSTIADRLKATSIPEWEFVDAFLAACEKHARLASRPLAPEVTDRKKWDHRLRDVWEIVESAHEDAKLAAAARVQLSRQLIPRQLPVQARHFTGRAAELASLSSLLHELSGVWGAVVIHAIDGTAGVGKTAVAVYWAHKIKDWFPHGQLYLNLRGFDPAGSAVTAAEAVRRFLDALGVPAERIPADLDAQAALYRSLLAGRRVMVVLDNCATAEQVRPLLPGSPGCLTVVTSRNRLTGLVAVEGAVALTLDLFTTDEARELIARQIRDERPAAEPEAVDDIIIQCVRLPLALSIVAARGADRPEVPLAVLADELRDTRRRLRVLDTGDPAANVTAAFSWSYNQLSPEAARLFRFLGVHAGPEIGPFAAASLAGVPLGVVQPALDELTGVRLLEEPVAGRFSFHDLLRAYASELAHTHDSETDLRSATHRVLDHYLQTAHTASLLWDPHRDPIVLVMPMPGVTPEHLVDAEQALSWLTLEYPVLFRAISQAAKSGFGVHTWQLAWSLVDFLNRQGHWHDMVTLQKLALTAAQELSDMPGQARAHRGIGRAYASLGRDDDSRTQLRLALDLFRNMGDDTGVAHVHIDLSRTAERQGDYHAALNHSEDALRSYEAGEVAVGQANALNGVGWYQALLGNYEQTMVACQRALGLLRELGDPAGQAATLDSLGYAHQHLGHHSEATQCYERAIELFRDIGDPYMQADTLEHLGDNHHAARHPTQARTAWQEALALFEQLGDAHRADPVRAKLADNR